MRPRADPTEQRKRIAEAVLRLMAQGGLEAVSLRTTAKEAGVSMGRVQYYFATKDDLLLEGLREAQERMEARFAERLQEAGGSGAQILRAILHEMLGETAETRDAIRIGLAFGTLARSDPQIAEIVGSEDDDIEALAESLIADAQREGRLNAPIDPAIEARGLLALASAFGLEAALYGGESDGAREVLDYHLQRVCPD